MSSLEFTTNSEKADGMTDKDEEKTKAREEKVESEEAVSGTAITQEKVFVSRFTNRPIMPDTCPTSPPVFWCNVCCSKLPPEWKSDHNSSTSVFIEVAQHFQSRSHKNNLKILKRPHENRLDNSGPSAKKANIDALDFIDSTSASSAVSSSANNGNGVLILATCEDCKIEFSHYPTAIEHFKGKKHKSVVVQKAANTRSSSATNSASSSTATSATSFLVTCDDCKLDFDNLPTALDHFIGKRHRAAVEKKVLKDYRAKDHRATALMGNRGTKDYGERSYGREKGYRGNKAASGRGPNRGSERGRKPYDSNSSPNSHYAPPSDFFSDTQGDIGIGDAQQDLPTAVLGESASKLRRGLITALLEEEERWIGGDNVNHAQPSLNDNGNNGIDISHRDSFFANGNSSDSRGGPSHHDPYNANVDNMGDNYSRNNDGFRKSYDAYGNAFT